MKKGLVYHKSLQLPALTENGYTHVELPWELREQSDLLKQHGIGICGVKIRLQETDEKLLREALAKARAWDAEYLMIDTCQVREEQALEQLLFSCADEVASSDLMVYIENGCCMDEAGNYQYGPFSEMSALSELCTKLNERCDKKRFFLCFNVGYANVLAKNLRAMAEENGDIIGVVHMNDNDGFHDAKQIPYTFTTGRGGKGTELDRVIGMLVQHQFQGWMIFDVDGMLERTPEPLQKPYLKLLSAIYDTWEREFSFEERVLNHPDKALILFGAGNMARNFLRVWGYKYWPEFLVDNNPNIWGMMLADIEIKAPQDILEIPPEYRNVVICSTYYDAIGSQLEQMGIAYECFWDQYYI
jgi:sugar phosphate isomerase/epimerase